MFEVTAVETQKSYSDYMAVQPQQGIFKYFKNIN
jgi:hypothetical protein